MTKKYIHKIFGGWGCDCTCYICGVHMNDFGPDDIYSIGGRREFEAGFVRGEDGFSHCIELIPDSKLPYLKERYNKNDFIICGLAKKYPDFKQKLEEN